MQISDIAIQVKTYQKDLVYNKEVFTEYDKGVYNGLEISLSIIEKRPSFLINSDKTFNKSDIEKYPEYFL